MTHTKTKPNLFGDPSVCGIDFGSRRLLLHKKTNHVYAFLFAAPSGANIPVSLSKTSAHTYEAAFQPKEVGPQQVAIFLGDEPIAGSPYVCNVFDVNKVTVSSLGRGSVGKPVTFGGRLAACSSSVSAANTSVEPEMRER